MPATVTEEPLGIECVFSDGSSARVDLDGLPCPALVRDLLLGLAELIHPHGTIDAAGSLTHYAQSIRHLARTLAAQGFTGGATDLRRGQMAEYWMASSGPKEACTRRMLHGLQLAGGRVDAKLAELAAGRAYNQQRSHHQLPPYPEDQWERLTQTCRRVVDESFARHKRALAAARHGLHPREHGWREDNLRWLLARIGPVGIVAFGQHLGCSDNVVRQRGGVLEASTDLFPRLDTVIAYRLLFGIYSGIVPDGIDDLVTDDIDWAGDSTVLLSYVKGRTAAESLNLPRRAVRLLEQWLAHSALLRSHAEPEQRRLLWLRLRKPGGTGITADVGSASRVAIQRWVVRHELLDTDGTPMKIHRSRIRTTFQSLRDKRNWAGRGRATIDPNHSPEVEGDHYLTATTPSQRRAVEAIVEDAQHDLLRKAHPPTVVTDEEAATLARDYPQLVAALNLDDTVVAELVGGQRDVFTAACADQLAGLHGPKGKPCPARPWVCLLCPLAVFAPRHAANLLRLKAFFSRQWQQMPAAQFMTVFGPYSQRIGHVLDRFDPAVVARAAVQVEDRDDELPVRPEESTR
ncbi:hypothetical protein DL991_32415 [Amycolatopsis sp. WAC 01375]|uniref:hypothetical protein n=1 Tax=Amycolatopsis sp. WAC 01375 TaxID=2203194 RepID=UPI000F7ACC60|nr:hypothetical protein [Amycolatopsis sp. WAC 01375]RSM72906.1 hypothetical protein DL991_32415 [Amycolatopsis sp. WAC 01375]